MEPIPIPRRVTFLTSGFHPSRFLESIDDYFTCPICAWVVRAPVACAHCETLYCKVCHDSVASIREDVCMRCRSQFVSAALRVYPKKVYHQYHLTCSNVNYGCKFEGTVEEVSQHEETCQHQLVDCQNPRCYNQFCVVDRLFEDKLVCSQRCWDAHEFVQMYQGDVSTVQCLEFFVNCVGLHKERFREFLQEKLQDKKEAAADELWRLKEQVKTVKKELSNILKDLE